MVVIQRLVAVAFGLVISLSAQASASDSCAKIPKGTASFTGKVVKNYDGDTLAVVGPFGKFSIRFLGIDTPETHYQEQSQGEWGERASEFLKEQAPVGTPVRVELGQGEACDTYGRILGHVWRDKVHLNKMIIQNAFAVTYCIYPNTRYCDELGDITNQNIAQRKGMFSDPTLELPYDFRRRVSNRGANQYVGDLKSHKVFAPGSNDNVPVGNRIFFYNEEDIKAPYHLAE